jgi:hypothetical protein
MNNINNHNIGLIRGLSISRYKHEKISHQKEG